jgi:hypothetical protein
MKLAIQIIDSLKNDPYGWEQGEFRLMHKASGASLWIANKYYGFGIKSPIEVDPPWLWKWRLWRAYQNWIWNYQVKGLE